MLKGVSLTNFKCYRSARIDMARLTVLSGRNAVGKSTLLQALCLMRQISLSQRDSGVVVVDGPLVRFGSVDDLINSSESRRSTPSVSIEVEGEAEWENGKLVLQRLEDDSGGAERNSMKITESRIPSKGGLTEGGFAYLSASRICPEEHPFRYPVTGFDRECNPMGNRGEFAVWHLGMNYLTRMPIQEFLCPGSEQQNTLGQQVSLWMGRLGQEVRAEPLMHDEIGIAGLRFALWEVDSFSKWYSPLNVGFGLTHCLPIYVALLSREKGSLVLIENPESHLHPKAQVEMGRFIAKAASVGIQVVVETHSDHVLNGIRLAVKEGTLAPNDVMLNFITPDDGSVRIVTPKVLRSGALDVWPRGFFDEYEISSLMLL